MNHYKAAPMAGFSDDDAQRLGEVIEGLGETVTPVQLVDAARSAKSPIHHLFLWDDTEAADRFRLHQARLHINHLRIVVHSRGIEETKAFHSVVITKDDERSRGYASMKTVASDPLLTEQVLQKAMAELRGWKSRHQEYQAIFGDVFAAIELAERKIELNASRNGRKPSARSAARAT